MWLAAPIVEEKEGKNMPPTKERQGHPARGSHFAAAGQHLLALVRQDVPWPEGPAHWAKARLVRYADDFVVLGPVSGGPGSKGG